MNDGKGNDASGQVGDASDRWRGGSVPLTADRRGRPMAGQWRNRKAGDGIRTHDNHVGNVVLYQLSYTRTNAGRRYLAVQSTVPAFRNPTIIGVADPAARSPSG